MSITIESSNNNLPIGHDDIYQTRFEQEKLKFLCSKQWEKVALAFIKDMKLQVAEGDVEELKKYLRLKRTECLDAFKKSDCFFVWDKCFQRDSNVFDGGSFLKKMEILFDGEIDAKDLEATFTYICMTGSIDLLLQKAIALEKRNSSTANQVFAQNLVFNNGTINVNTNAAADSVDNGEEEEILRNIIFIEKLFDSNVKLQKLRDEIARSIDMGDYNNVFGEMNRKRIDPGVQSEWYYILKAIEESGVAKRRFLVGDFVNQMLSWYPWTFYAFQTLEEKNEFVRKMEKSISHEKSLWKYGPAKEMTCIRDMWARWRLLQIDFAKVERVQPIVKALYDGLTNLKSEMEKENNIKYR